MQQDKHEVFQKVAVLFRGNDASSVLHKWYAIRLAKITENAILRLMADCTVSYVDLDGIRHSVEVEAEGLYEASVLAICAFRKHELTPFPFGKFTSG
jgi:hypothetical protein